MSDDRSHPNHPDYVRPDQQTGEVDDAPVLEGDIIEPIGKGVLAVLHRVEIDQQIATAKAYPRNVMQIKQELKALVTMDEDTAEECVYALPRGGKTINGPSARFADALILFWGNSRSGAFITEVNREDKYVEAIGSFQDVERNVIRQRRTRRPIANARGQLYSADMINMTGNAACVIAERNAITNGIPKPFWGPIYDAAFSIVAGTTQTLGDKIARAKKGFLAMEIDFALVLEKIGRADESKIVPQDIVALRGMLTALKTGEETIESVFGRGAGANFEHVKNPLKDDAPRGNAREVAEAGTVISATSQITKSREGEISPPVFDMRLNQTFATLVAWAKAAKDLPDPRFPAPQGEQQAESGGKSGTNGPETKDNSAGEHAKTPVSDRVESQVQPDPGRRQSVGGHQPDTDRAAPDNPPSGGSSGRPAQEPAGPAAADAAPAKETAQASLAGLAKPYSDAPGYMTYMRDSFDRAKAKGVVTDLWSATRADRNELLDTDQIDELTKDKESKLRSLKLKEGK